MTVYKAEGARIVGDVSIGDESSVWFNAVIRGDSDAIRIGNRVNIQDNCVIHCDKGFPVSIGNDVTVGHAAIIHGAVIEDNVLIGMGAIVMDGALIRKNSIVAAGALVTGNHEFEEGSLILGNPAKTKRPLSESEIEYNRLSAEHYAALAKAELSAEE